MRRNCFQFANANSSFHQAAGRTSGVEFRVMLALIVLRRRAFFVCNSPPGAPQDADTQAQSSSAENRRQILRCAGRLCSKWGAVLRIGLSLTIADTADKNAAGVFPPTLGTDR